MIRFDNTLGFVADHAPGDDLDYGFTWQDVLEEGESIGASEWTATTGITLSRGAVSGSVTSTFAAGGVDGQRYQLVNSITTAGGRKYNRMITLLCKKAIR